MGLPVVSLFTGAGGLDLGMERAGFETRVAVEVAPYCQETLALNRARGYWPHLRAVFGDIREVRPAELLRAAGLAPGEAFLVTGGPPCQAFSTAGKRLSVQDPRGGLLFSYIEVVRAVRPRFFVFENVRGILSAAIRHRPLAERGDKSRPLAPEEELGSLLRRVVLPLLREGLGYEVVYGVLNAADYGVPQDRQRVFFIGSRDWELGSSGYLEHGAEMPIALLFPPTHSRDGSGGLPRWRTLADALEGLEDREPEYIPYSPARAAVFALVPPGCNWRYLRDRYGEEFAQRVLGGAYRSSGGRVGFWRRLAWDRPCPTLVANPVQKGTGLCHPEETRPLSVREYARVQQFPDDYVFAGTTAQKYTQIGNAVPVGLAEYLGRRLRELAEGTHPVRARRGGAQGWVQGVLFA
ncbi:DNA cytosine methyltransferase [Ammonifex thiophilus]|uniref:DNA cytosine methyltransferase n=1 Tax=Ammonifex thiophilus TaxID=444093 RepID=UPI00196B9081|nr:DNA cytosine methyltransferase [Ammonifex thiophilus]